MSLLSVRYAESARPRALRGAIVVLLLGVLVLIAGGRPAALAQIEPVVGAGAPIIYQPGWNLVSGPDGSTVSGAIGNLYTLQPGDTEYEVLPLDTSLRACVGYWAYFPRIGVLNDDESASQHTCSTSPTPGAWMMIGNPSIDAAAATINGADQALLYDATSGYQATTSIPSGTGAWVLGSTDVSVTAPFYRGTSLNLGGTRIRGFYVATAGDYHVGVVNSVTSQTTEFDGTHEKYSPGNGSEDYIGLGLLAPASGSNATAATELVNNGLIQSVANEMASDGTTFVHGFTASGIIGTIANFSLAGSQGVGEQDESATFTVTVGANSWRCALVTAARANHVIVAYFAYYGGLAETLSNAEALTYAARAAAIADNMLLLELAPD